MSSTVVFDIVHCLGYLLKIRNISQNIAPTLPLWLAARNSLNLCLQDAKNL
jgi:hypothetical protein